MYVGGREGRYLWRVREEKENTVVSKIKEEERKRWQEFRNVVMS